MTKAAAGRMKNGDFPNLRFSPEKLYSSDKTEKRTAKTAKKMWNLGKKTLKGMNTFPNVAQKKNIKKTSIKTRHLLNLFISTYTLSGGKNSNLSIIKYWLFPSKPGVNFIKFIPFSKKASNSRLPRRGFAE